MTRAIMARGAAFVFLLAAACSPGFEPDGPAGAAGMKPGNAADARFLADHCKGQGLPDDRCNCLANEIAKLADAPMLARGAEHLRAREGEVGAKSMTQEDILEFRAVQAKARDICIALYPVTMANMDDILGKYLMKECVQTGAGQRLCQCQWDDFRNRAKPDTRLAMAHAAAGDPPEDYPMSPAQGFEVAIANKLSLERCVF